MSALSKLAMSEMKFWQLNSVAGAAAIAEAAGGDVAWAVYGELVRDLPRICEIQDRAKLDYEMPKEFVRRVLSGSPRGVFLSHGQLRSFRFAPSDNELSFVEAFDQFGGTALEEALEKGSFAVSVAVGVDVK